tara:strand:- start:1080 stop:1319 length:240 start_codon:yes stop_codon:yes gene_type:complete
MEHSENILELISKTIYETTFMSKEKDGSYRRQLDRIKKMVKMYAEEYAESILEESIENTTSTEDIEDTPTISGDTKERL